MSRTHRSRLQRCKAKDCVFCRKAVRARLVAALPDPDTAKPVPHG